MIEKHHLFFSIISIYNKLAEFMLNRWKVRQIRQNRLNRCILYFTTVGSAGSVSALCLFLALLNFIKVQISQALLRTARQCPPTFACLCVV